jgi:peptide/nickel transport system permease protein
MGATNSNLLILAGVVFVGFLVFKMLRVQHWQRAWARLRRDRTGMVSCGVIGLYLFIGLLASIQIPADRVTGQHPSVLDWLFRKVPTEETYSAPLATETFQGVKSIPLQGRHLLGTDILGKDTLLQTLKACRTALIIGMLTSLIYLPVGTILGIAAGFYRKRVDDAVQYVYSVLASIPGILLLIAILMILGKGLPQMAIALGVTGWVGLCRLIRGETLRQSGRPYVEAARALGQSNMRIIFDHLLPNVMHLVFINFILGFSGLVLAEAILSYLGVGAPIGTASWGIMIDSARLELSRDPVVWWNLASAASALFILVLSLNLFGDSLRRAFDPRG